MHTETFHPSPTKEQREEALSRTADTLQEAIRRGTARMRNPQFRAAAVRACREGKILEFRLCITGQKDGRMKAKVFITERTEQEMLYSARNLPEPATDEVWESTRDTEGGQS